MHSLVYTHNKINALADRTDKMTIDQRCLVSIVSEADHPHEHVGVRTPLRHTTLILIVMKDL